MGAVGASASGVVITHDFAETFGGAERVLARLCACFPEAPVFALGARRSVAERIGIEDRLTTLLPDREPVHRWYRNLAPLYPVMVRRARLPDAAVLLSSSYAFAHHFRTSNRAPQLCYCHSPLRFAWTMTGEYREQRRGFTSGAIEPVAAYLRRADRRAAAGIDRILANGSHVADQVERFWGKPAEIVPPPVDLELFRPQPGRIGDHFLLCARLIEPYKQPSLVIDAFRSLPERELRIAGDGPAMSRLRASAPPNVTFLGALADHELVHEMASCAAVIFPSRDDLGLIPVEVAACGRPTIAFRGGGALETVVEGVTGEFFDEQESDALVEAVRAFDPGRYDEAVLREHASHWSADDFDVAVSAAVEEVGT